MNPPRPFQQPHNAAPEEERKIQDLMAAREKVREAAGEAKETWKALFTSLKVQMDWLNSGLDENGKNWQRNDRTRFEAQNLVEVLKTLLPMERNLSEKALKEEQNLKLLEALGKKLKQHINVLKDVKEYMEKKMNRLKEDGKKGKWDYSEQVPVPEHLLESAADTIHDTSLSLVFNYHGYSSMGPAFELEEILYDSVAFVSSLFFFFSVLIHLNSSTCISTLQAIATLTRSLGYSA